MVKVNNIPYGNPFAKVRFQAVDSLIQNLFQFAAVPFPGCRIRHVQNSHPCLPHIRLPDRAVGFPDQIAVLLSFLKERRRLGNIGIDPCAQLQAFFMIPFQHALRIRKNVRIPGEITPVVCLHPVTVKMENTERDVPFRHSVDQ